MGECIEGSVQTVNLMKAEDKSVEDMPPLIPNPKKRKVSVDGEFSGKCLSPASSRTSSCSVDDDHESNKSLKDFDVKSESSETGTETETSTALNEEFLREETPTNEDRMPSAEELEEFFATAEKSDHKWFCEKYNFDILKDLPLEGKYEWVSLHP